MKLRIPTGGQVLQERRRPPDLASPASAGEAAAEGAGEGSSTKALRAGPSPDACRRRPLPLARARRDRALTSLRCFVGRGAAPRLARWRAEADRACFVLQRFAAPLDP